MTTEENAGRIAAEGGGGMPAASTAGPGGPAIALDYFGGMRMAPSRRIVSPLSMSLVMMLWTSLA